MSTVDKMLIKGIRSFDPENKNVITFFKPLTLIVGPNGAGKTTIIECLKLSCTGELPPNSRSGHTFVHDPKVAGETETKGQIKLRFKTAAGKDVVCIRSFQLTQKASKMEFKAIESVLQTINPHTGEKVCLSYRCADMDREIPALMGVSKAILENVIFVHQDESNWPLQDPSTLKKKFDDIFSATRYTKALEVIKKLHKDQAQEIKTFRLKLENLHTLKDQAYRLHDSIAQDQEKSDALKTQMEDLKTNIEAVENKIRHTGTGMNELRKLQEQISTKATARSTYFTLQQQQYAALSEENEDTDEELKEWQTKFEERITLMETKIGKLEREMNDEKTSTSSLSVTMNDLTLEIGKLQAEANAHMSVKHKQDAAIRNIFTKHNLGTIPDALFTDDVAMNLTNRIKARLSNLEDDLQDKKKSNDTHLEFLWERYLRVNARYSEVDGQIQSKRESQVGISRRMKDKENERDAAEMELSKYNLARIDERERHMQIEVERKTLALGERDYDLIISQKRPEIYTLDHKIKALYREKDNITNDADDRVKLELKKDELEKCKKKRKKIYDEHKDKIKSVLKWLPSEKDLKKEITQAFGSVDADYNGLNSKSQEAEQLLKFAQMKVDGARSRLSKFQKDLDAKRKHLDAKLQSITKVSVDINKYPKILKDAMDDRDKHRNQYNLAKGMRIMYDPYEKIARDSHKCPCCDRAFTPDEEDWFVKKQRATGTSSAEHMKVLEIVKSDAEDFFKQLDDLRGIYDEYVKLGKEAIPLAEKDLEQLLADESEKAQTFEDLVSVLAQVKMDRDGVEDLLHPIETIDRHVQEIQDLEPQVQDLEYKLDSRGQGVRSLEEIQLELNSVQRARDTLIGEVDHLRDQQKILTEDLSNAQMRWHALREEKVSASSIVDKFKKAEQDLVHIAEEKEQLNLDRKHLEEALVPLSEERESLLQEYKALKERLEQEFEQLAERKRGFQQEIDALGTLNTQIKEYLDSKKAEKLNELQEKHKLNLSELQKHEARKQDISAELDRSKEVLRTQDQFKRNIDDNLNYRKTKAEVDRLTHDIELLEDNVLSIGSMSTIEADLKRHAQEKERLLSEYNRCQGTISVYQSNISKHKLELKQTQYKDIEKRYFNQLLQLKTTEMANKDLDRYYAALDKALMRFHTMKMEEINKIIKELWQQTYRGQDIDCISINSDSEGAGTRSYSYRVVMQNGGAELEMRGRCSAGQKVLASLIIRLALAETFCLNCGILALDEPTTNLDGPNAESLAAALLRIMESRKGQENFQLIIITHDERFAQLIGQRQLAEKYYRVSKDELQHSKIEAQEIFD
ncbi:DNA repair protein RAD50 isoform X1 [Lolium perenne]|uniref:DNA repair protein RAD50 isoform X1 n=1 Tax=Lolium perenne TaxID=4522 RepID=UPI0021F65764|nr:DNA repair protein RAD50 isoform X1 [Lolium perenne]